MGPGVVVIRAQPAGRDVDEHAASPASRGRTTDEPSGGPKGCSSFDSSQLIILTGEEKPLTEMDLKRRSAEKNKKTAEAVMPEPDSLPVFLAPSS